MLQCSLFPSSVCWFVRIDSAVNNEKGHLWKLRRQIQWELRNATIFKCLKRFVYILMSQKTWNRFLKLNFFYSISTRWNSKWICAQSSSFFQFHLLFSRYSVKSIASPVRRAIQPTIFIFTLIYSWCKYYFSVNVKHFAKVPLSDIFKSSECIETCL